MLGSIATRGKALLEARFVETGRLHSFDRLWQTTLRRLLLLRGTTAGAHVAADDAGARRARADADGALASLVLLDSASGIEPPAPDADGAVVASASGAAQPPIGVRLLWG